MANYSVTIYNNLYEAAAAIESIDNSTDIIVHPFKDGVQNKVMVLEGVTDANDMSLSGVTDSTLSALKIVEQEPLDKRGFKETLFDAVTTIGVSTDFYVLDKKQLTVEVTASSVTNGATINIEGTTDNTNYGTLGIVGNDGTVIQSINITASGTYFYEVINASSIEYIRANLNSRTDGIYTVKLLGGAL